MRFAYATYFRRNFGLKYGLYGLTSSSPAGGPAGGAPADPPPRPQDPPEPVPVQDVVRHLAVARLVRLVEDGEDAVESTQESRFELDLLGDQFPGDIGREHV